MEYCDGSPPAAEFPSALSTIRNKTPIRFARYRLLAANRCGSRQPRQAVIAPEESPLGLAHQPPP